MDDRIAFGAITGGVVGFAFASSLMTKDGDTLFQVIWGALTYPSCMMAGAIIGGIVAS